jgi:hypothetical protein
MYTLNKRGSEYYTVDLPRFETIGEIFKENGGSFVFAFTSDTTKNSLPEYFFVFVSKHLEVLNKKLQTKPT